MLLKQFKKIELTEPDSKKLQDNLQVLLNEVTSRTMLGGNLLKNVTLVAGTKNRIAHKLGEEPDGYVVVKKKLTPSGSSGIGQIRHFPFELDVPGLLRCDGRAISRTTYSDLFNVIGTTYGVGDGSTTFNIPDSRQKFWMGKADSGTGSTFGATGGAIDHTHTVKKHYHGMGTGADLNVTASGSGTTGNESVGHKHLMITNAEGDTTLSASNQVAIQETTSPGTATNYALVGSGFDTSIGLSGFANTSHTHNTPNHTHASADIAGRIGVVTGGVDGNADQNSGTANPPYVVGDYYITADINAALSSMDVWDSEVSVGEKDLYLWLYSSVDVTVSLWVF